MSNFVWIYHPANEDTFALVLKFVVLNFLEINYYSSKRGVGGFSICIPTKFYATCLVLYAWYSVKLKAFTCLCLLYYVSNEWNATTKGECGMGYTMTKIWTHQKTTCWVRLSSGLSLEE
jgi:hypothetical protein